MSSYTPSAARRGGTSICVLIYYTIHAVILVHNSTCVLIYCNTCVPQLSCGESSRRTRSSTSSYHYICVLIYCRICVLIYCHICVSRSSSCGESSRLTSSSRLTKPPPRLQQVYLFYVPLYVSACYYICSRLTKPPPRRQQAYVFSVPLYVSACYYISSRLTKPPPRLQRLQQAYVFSVPLYVFACYYTTPATPATDICVLCSYMCVRMLLYKLYVSMCPHTTIYVLRVPMYVSASYYIHIHAYIYGDAGVTTDPSDVC